MSMGIGNKSIAQDFINLKARVKAEMLRRNGSGSLTAYAGVAYDYTAVPVVGGKVKIEHYSKVRDTMTYINPATVSLPAKIVGDKKQAMNLLEANMTSYEAKPRSDRTASDCAAGCSGVCISTCSTACVGCSSCSSCSGSCDGCSGCSGSCSGGCSGCSGSCSGSCSSCTGSCTGFCSTGCSGCTSCSGCSGCGGACQDDCTAESY